jgi:putative transposase
VTKFAFVSAERTNHAVTTLCRVIGASVSGFYAWLRAIPSHQSRAEADAELRGHIGRIFAAKRRVYGSPRSMLSCAGRATGTHVARSSG